MQPQFLVCLDFSPTSLNALGFAARYARDYKGALHLVHVVNYPGIYSGAERRDLYEEEATEAANQRFEELRAEWESKVPSFQTEVLKGDPSALILEYADQIEADIIFVGVRGDRVSESPFMGEVALNVVRRSNRAVMVVDELPFDREGTPLALAPVNRRFGVRGLLQYLSENTIGFKAKVDLLNVFREGDSEDQTTRFLERKVTELEKAGIEVGEAVIVDGDEVSLAILSYMANTVQSYDLVLLENRDHAKFGELTIGGAMEDIILHCRQPVLCLRVTNPEEEPEE